MKRAYSPKDIAAKKWVTLPWGEKWNKPFGFPAENASWFISGASASGKSSFVMQLSKELCKYGLVLYLSYEEGREPDIPTPYGIFEDERGARQVPCGCGRDL